MYMHLLPNRTWSTFSWLIAIALLTLCFDNIACAQDNLIPESLKPWKDWAQWDEFQRRAPFAYNDGASQIEAWPKTLTIDASSTQCTWQLELEVYRKCWVSIPGDQETWPFDVQTQQGALPVLLRDGQPSIQLSPGRHSIHGEFRWSAMPQKLMLPKSIGIIALRLDGSDIAFPNWDSTGALWLKRQQSDAAEQNLLTLKVYRVIEDGIPIWLRTKVELSASGKSREENLGQILPEGWELSSVESPIPVAIDDSGLMKAQVRPGNWIVNVDAFRSSDLQRFQFPPQSKPLADTELIGLRQQLSFRKSELEGLQAIDVQQTTFPDEWRALPVFQWNTNSGFNIVEKMRGMGSQKPKGLTVRRRFWLDDDGKGITYQDLLSGELQQSWRLDSAADHVLGAVRIDQVRQLITANPSSGATGVEIRSRNPVLEALGRIERAKNIPATGWAADADSLELSLSLPPGWRVFMVRGADRVTGDWLTTWTLLDLFLVLIFSLAVYRLWGIPAGVLALIAFGLSYHEPGSPRWTWLFLLMPIALLRVVGEGSAKRWISGWRAIALILLLLNLVPFVARQVQIVLYPQLEMVGIPYGSRPMFPWINATYETSGRVASSLQEDYLPVPKASDPTPLRADGLSTNLAFDPSAHTQTGPALPEWSGNEILCSWDGPVTSEQEVTPIYISRNLNRFIIIARSILLLLLLALLVGTRPISQLFMTMLSRRKIVATAVAFAMAVLPATAYGQFPDQELLKTLKERLEPTIDSFPNAANIAQCNVSIDGNRLKMELEIHSAGNVAIPLPGKLPTWSPITVSIASKQQPEKTEAAVVSRREDGHLWVVTSQGVQSVVVEGIIPDSNEWVLAFPLLPHRASVVAPQWQIVGIGPNGIPENQLFFSRVEKSGDSEVNYDQRVYSPIVLIERRLEIGLIWKVQNRVTRLSAPGKAISLKIPLLPGERVVSSITEQSSGTIDVNLAADQTNFDWESELSFADQLTLKAAATDQYVERWVLVSSPVWNITFTGRDPVYEPSRKELVPVWQVWPGEEVSLAIRRPQAIDGAILTIKRVSQNLSIGTRQRSSQLTLDVESSLGGDFVMELDPEAEITSLKVANLNQPVRRNGSQLIVPLQPGVQPVELGWTVNEPMQMAIATKPITLPVESANVTTTIDVPASRWVLWTNGPQRGPAVRFWIFLVTALLVAVALGTNPASPLRTYEWILLALGLTQLHAIAGLLVVAWFGAIVWRGRLDPSTLSADRFNFSQVGLVALTFIVLGIFLVLVGKGLLGQPEMFIVGNGSWPYQLNWFAPKTGTTLPEPSFVSISIWWYRLFMLLWALWLATSLLRWLQQGWISFSHGGRWISQISKELTKNNTEKITS